VSGLFAVIKIPSSSGCCLFSKAPQCRRVILIVRQPFDDKIDVAGWCCTGRTGERRSPGSRCPRELGLRSILQSAQVPLGRATRPGPNRHCGRWRRNCTQLRDVSGIFRKANCRTGKCRAQHSAHLRSLRHPVRNWLLHGATHGLQRTLSSNRLPQLRQSASTRISDPAAC